MKTFWLFCFFLCFALLSCAHVPHPSLPPSIKNTEQAKIVNQQVANQQAKIVNQRIANQQVANRQAKATNQQAKVTTKLVKTNQGQKSPTPSLPPFEKGLSLFQKGHLRQARAVFENINRGDTHFVPALVELQKINYKENQWDRFFGLALYYRNFLLSSPESVRKNFKQNPLALEILALIRHCRFKESKKIKEWSLNMAQTINKNPSKIKKTSSFFKLKKLVGDQNQNQKAKDLKEQISLWPLKKQELKWVDNPRNLRVKVKSQC